MTNVSLEKNVTLLDLLDRILDKGMIIGGDVTISIAGIDLVYVGLRALVSSVETLEQRRGIRVGELASSRVGELGSRRVGELGSWGVGELASGRVGESQPANSQTREPVDPQTRKPADPPTQQLDFDPVDPKGVENGLARLVVIVVELLRRLMERQAVRRVDGGLLTDVEIDRLGEAFLRLQDRMGDLKAAFGLTDEDLNLNLGPLGDLM